MRSPCSSSVLQGASLIGWLRGLPHPAPPPPDTRVRVRRLEIPAASVLTAPMPGQHRRVAWMTSDDPCEVARYRLDLTEGRQYLP